MGMYKKKEGRSGKCFVYCLATFVILCVILLVFASLLRVKNPNLKLTSAASNQMSYSASPSSFNATLVISLVIKNPNLGVFSYQNNSVSVLYAGAKIADAQIDGDRSVSFKQSKEINVTVKLRMSAKVPVVNANLSGDINSGSLNLTSNVKLSGTVHLLNIFNIRKSIETTCAINLNLASHAIQGIQCQ